MKTHLDRRTLKKSLNAMGVANDVIKAINTKKKINLEAIQISNGYSVKSARSQRAIRTKTFRVAVMPVLDRMKRLHEKAILSLDKRELDKETINDVVNLSRQMVHDSQLLSGKATDNVGVKLVLYGSNDFLALQQGNIEQQG